MIARDIMLSTGFQRFKYNYAAGIHVSLITGCIGSVNTRPGGWTPGPWGGMLYAPTQASQKPLGVGGRVFVTSGMIEFLTDYYGATIGESEHKTLG